MSCQICRATSVSPPVTMNDKAPLNAPMTTDTALRRHERPGFPTVDADGYAGFLDDVFSSNRSRREAGQGQ